MIAIARRVFLCILLAIAAEPELTGKVVGVHDGDTLTLLVDRTQYKIRLDGIDAPELGPTVGVCLAVEWLNTTP